MDAFESLNEQQRAAVLTTEGQVRIIAGPGTGKTRTLTQRYCHLVSNLGIAPGNILCVTFTNRAANEMKKRVREALGDLDLGYICTFHAFCVQLLKDDIHVLNFPRNFVILDTEDQKQILLKIFSDMGLSLRDTTVKRALDGVLEARKLHAATYIDDIYLLNNEQLKARFSRARDRDEEIFFRYLYEQKKCFGCDFNDLINFAVYILEKFTETRLKWQSRMQYVMVDEFQDVSARQYRLARLLSGRHGNLFIVGDPDQTIYTWRGSHIRMFLDFDKIYPKARTVTLSVNYRSTPEITRAANSLIAKNQTRQPKVLHPTRDSSAKPLFAHAKSERDEADWIFSEIDSLRRQGVSPGRVAVLYRAHYLTRALEERFISGKLPYRIFSGIEFYGRREIKDIICYLRMLTAGDDMAFLRTINLPSRKIGRKRLSALAEYSEARGLSLYEGLHQNLDSELFRGTQARSFVDAVERVRAERKVMSLGDTLQMLLDCSGYEEFLRLQGDQDRLDNVAELKRSVAAFGEDDDAALEDYLARAALFSNLDHEEKKDAVKLMTVHASKGMEFPYVFICGLNEGIFPGRRVNMPEEMEEERRLAYVAMTRAMDRLYLSDSEGLGNDGIFKYPSRFIFDIGRENLDYRSELDGHFLPGKNAAGVSYEDLAPPSFATGDLVIHPFFGRGKVVAINQADGCYSIHFDNLPTERGIRFNAQLKPAVSSPRK
jgi:DNA helicase-2/ATP-dependent DNA helicase PcrA